MDSEFKRRLEQGGVSIDEALARLSGDETAYFTGLKLFLTDPTMQKLSDAVEAENWDGAYFLSMTLQGVSGNLGFTTLHKLACELERSIRNSRFDKVPSTYKMIKQNYNELSELLAMNSELPD